MRQLKVLVNNALRSAGYQIIRVPSGRMYNTNIPVATYAPWNTDTAFQSVWQAIRNNTLVDIYRCWELWNVVGQVAKLSGSLIEVGVWRGGTGALIARAALNMGLSDPVYLCDTFRGVVKAGSHDTIYKGGEHADTSIPTVTSLMSSLGVDNYRILEGIFPEDTAHLIPAEERFRLCHIDVDVYESAAGILKC